MAREGTLQQQPQTVYNRIGNKEPKRMRKPATQHGTVLLNSTADIRSVTPHRPLLLKKTGFYARFYPKKTCPPKGREICQNRDRSQWLWGVCGWWCTVQYDGLGILFFLTKSILNLMSYKIYPLHYISIAQHRTAQNITAPAPAPGPGHIPAPPRPDHHRQDEHR
jgi:hypothetical protein